MTETTDELTRKVSEWVHEEGYPLEYFTANTFRHHKFDTRQGNYTRDGEEHPREIDVCATMTWQKQPQKGLIRAYNVVECKSSRSKPWIVFTSPTNQMMPSAVVAQTISSRVAQAGVWANAGNPSLTSLELFQSPKSGGFGGRQAFSKGQDKFFDAIRSVVSASNSIASRYDRYRVSSDDLGPCVVTFPVVVIDGILFEASYREDDEALALVKTDRVRCHWRGSDHSSLLTTIDIVTKDGLPEFARQRAMDFTQLLSALSETYGELQRCRKHKDVKHLSVSPAPRGVIGWPPLLRDIMSGDEG